MWGVFLIVLRYQLERRRQHAEMEATLESLDASLLPIEQGRLGESNPRPETNNAL
jgi:hypothetical protein